LRRVKEEMKKLAQKSPKVNEPMKSAEETKSSESAVQAQSA
jgi:hypothetical protein